jgi:cobalt-zinc-cadmium efflux system protein
MPAHHAHPHHDHASPDSARHGHTHHDQARHAHAMTWPLLLILGFAVVEAVGGYLSGSLALLSDAGHMLVDALSLGLTAFAAFIVRKPASERHSYGLVRAEVMIALVNALFMLAVIIGIAWEAIQRLRTPHPVSGGIVLLLALAGVAINAGVAYQLHGQEQNINIRGALLHVLGDLAASVATVIAGAVIYSTGWTTIDPLLSLFVAVLIGVSALGLLREVVNILMESVPAHIDLAAVAREMAAQPNVATVHDVHIWTLSSGLVALSAHVVIHDLAGWPKLLGEMRDMLAHRFEIHHVTLQPEVPAWEALSYYSPDAWRQQQATRGKEPPAPQH